MEIQNSLFLLEIVDKVGKSRSTASLFGGIGKQAKPAAGEVVQLKVQLVDRAQLCPVFRSASPVEENRLILHLVEVSLYPQLHLRALPGNALPFLFRGDLRSRHSLEFEL